MKENSPKRGKFAAIPATQTNSSVSDFFRLLSQASRVRSQSPLKMASRPTSKERPEKILVAMYKLAHGGTKPLKYEDIVVKAFEMFPEEFALRGYPQYPDSSDLHKPLYGPLKRQGLVRSANKMFALTPRGAEVGKRLVEAAGSTLEEAMGDARRITRTQQAEVERMLSSAAHELFSKGESGRILDTDFYRFIGCTVRTPRNEFLGRMTATEGAVKAAKKLGFPSPEAARALHDEWEFMTKQFKTLIDRQKGEKDGSGKPQDNPAEE